MLPNMVIFTSPLTALTINVVKHCVLTKPPEMVVVKSGSGCRDGYGYIGWSVAANTVMEAPFTYRLSFQGNYLHTICSTWSSGQEPRGFGCCIMTLSSGYSSTIDSPAETWIEPGSLGVVRRNELFTSCKSDVKRKNLPRLRRLSSNAIIKSLRNVTSFWLGTSFSKCKQVSTNHCSPIPNQKNWRKETNDWLKVV